MSLISNVTLDMHVLYFLNDVIDTTDKQRKWHLYVACIRSFMVEVLCHGIFYFWISDLFIYLHLQCYNTAFDGLVQDCGNSSALAMELLQFYDKPSIWLYWSSSRVFHR